MVAEVSRLCIRSTTASNRSPATSSPCEADGRRLPRTGRGHLGARAPRWRRSSGCEGDRVSLQVFAGSRGIATDARSASSATPCRCPSPTPCWAASSPAAASRATAARPCTENLIDIGGPSVNPAKRIIPRNMVRTGIPMIDVFNTLVESQKLPDLLRRRRALQPAAGPHRAAGRGGRHHPRRHGPEARRLPLLPRHAGRAGRPVPHGAVRPHRGRPHRGVPAGARTSAWPWPSSSPCRASACWCC